MKIMIHGQDYTSALDAVRQLTIERKLNEPSICQFSLSLPADGSLARPSRNQSITVVGDDGTTYFTGYIVVSPLPEYSGFGIEGPRFRIAIQAVSDEVLLDQQLLPSSKGATGETAGALITTLVTRSGSTALSTRGLSLSSAVNSFIPNPGAPWSKSAGQVATLARAAYRALNGALTLLPIQSTVHPLKESDDSLSLGNLGFNASFKRVLANDVTVCGEHEPVAYVTEYFQGDGITTQFYLSADPYFPAAAETTIIRELFGEPAIDQRVWGNTGESGYLALGSAGLAMNGGNGIDGQTALSWLDQVEMGGSLLLEAEGVTLSPFSSGILAGFFNGGTEAAACTAGFQVTAQQGTGSVTLQPIVQGISAGTTFAINAGNQYTIRLRIHCPECRRAHAIYRSFGDGGPIAAGGEWILSPAKLQFEIQEFVNGVGAMPVTLYDGALANVPGACTVVAASSLSLTGSMRALNLTNLGSGWVVSTPPSGTAYTRRIGTTEEGGECQVQRTGKVLFYAGYVPVAGEQIAVCYRSVGRAVGRAVNTASQQALLEAGSPAVAAWIGSVTEPPARCSADCRNAALVLEQAAAGVSASWNGTFKGTNQDFSCDVWPGDALLLDSPSANLDAQVVVRTVKVSYRASVPDLVDYFVMFANDWAEDLAIKTSVTVPADAWLSAPVAPALLANLTGLIVTTLNGCTVGINIGVTPPTGGGFEIRRRDFAFMPGNDPGLVARTSEPNITFSREGYNDRFYIRMYDAATPPNYSEFSTALFINLPLGS
ncbi:MAG TPA: hypothetical protein VH308_09725 [Terracidiphilus sp.]|nr:hypothetical protein [Terracidiphilus sp.]